MWLLKEEGLYKILMQLRKTYCKSIPERDKACGCPATHEDFDMSWLLRRRLKNKLRHPTKPIRRLRNINRRFRETEKNYF